MKWSGNEMDTCGTEQQKADDNDHHDLDHDQCQTQPQSWPWQRHEDPEDHDDHDDHYDYDNNAVDGDNHSDDDSVARR